MAMGGFQDGPSWKGFKFLRQIADSKMWAFSDDALLRGIFSNDHTKKRGFSRSVRTDQADPRMGPEMGGRPIEQGFGRVPFRDIFNV